MGFCFFTENTTLNIHSLGLNVGQLVHCICVGGGGGGGGGAGIINVAYFNRVNAANATLPNMSANGGNGGTGGITSFGRYVSAAGGGGGLGAVQYVKMSGDLIPSGGITYGTSSLAGGVSVMNGCNGGSGGGNCVNVFYSGTGSQIMYTTNSAGGSGGGFGQYVYKSFVLEEENIPITIGARGAGGAKGPGRNYNFYYFSTNNTWTTDSVANMNGGAGGSGGHGGANTTAGTAGGGGSGFGSGGGGGGGRPGTKSNTGTIGIGGGGGGGAGGYFIGEQRIYSKAGVSAFNSQSGGASGVSLDYSTLYPASGSGVSGRTYPVLDKAGCGVCILMW